MVQMLNCEPCQFTGFSMGGFVGLRLATNRPELLRSLTLIDTSVDPEPPLNRFKYSLMTVFARHFGFRPMMSQILPLTFGHTFLSDPERLEEKMHWQQCPLAGVY